MLRLSDTDRFTLDQFVGAALARLRDGRCTVAEAKADLMHALSAWDRGSVNEFRTWMETTLKDWEAEEA